MSFPFKVASGLQVRVTSRRLRTVAGPHGAGVRGGTGRTGYSGSLRPTSVYRAAGGGRQRKTSTTLAETVVDGFEYQLWQAEDRNDHQLRQAGKAQQADSLRNVFHTIENLHRQEFAQASPPIAPPPAPVDELEIRRRHEQQALRGLGVTQTSARAEARALAAETASRNIERMTRERQQERRHIQQQLTEQWHRLLDNDPDLVSEVLAEAFEDSEPPAAVTGVQGNEASIVVLVPSVDAVPDRMPQITQAGNLSLAPITKGQRNAFYLKLVCGHVLAAVREALAVAPGLDALRVACVRLTPADGHGVRQTKCLLAGVFARVTLRDVRWHLASSDQILRGTATGLCMRLTASQELRPLDLSREPDLAALIEAIVYGDEAPHQAPPTLQFSTAGSPRMPVSPVARLPHGRVRGTKGRQRQRSSRHIALTVGGVALLILVVAGAVGVGTKNAGQTAAVSTASPVVEASPVLTTAAPATSPSTHPAAPESAIRNASASVQASRTPAAADVTSAATPTQSEPVVSPSTTGASSATAVASQTCTPKTSAGNCYQAGEFCRTSDHGAAGYTAAGGKILCEDNDGWRWEPA